MFSTTHVKKNINSNKQQQALHVVVLVKKIKLRNFSFLCRLMLNFTAG